MQTFVPIPRESWPRRQHKNLKVSHLKKMTFKIKSKTNQTNHFGVVHSLGNAQSIVNKIDKLGLRLHIQTGYVAVICLH